MIAWIEPADTGWASVRMLTVELRREGYDAEEHRVIGEPRIYLHPLPLERLSR